MRLLYLFVEARSPICNAGFQPARNVAALTQFALLTRVHLRFVAN